MIRVARYEDLPQLVSLAATLPTAPHWSEGAWRSELTPSQQSRSVFVWEQDHVLRGFAVVSALLGHAELENIGVQTEWQRRGLGEALLQAVLAWCHQHGCHSLLLEVRASSRAAQRLYQKAGFQACGVRKSYYQHPEEDAILMELLLTA